MGPSDIGTVFYRLNDRDEIASVNAAWDLFAAENDSAHLAGSQVLGRPLWDFISDPTTRFLYQELLARARADRPARFHYRCDSPDRRRFMEMEIAGAADGSVEFRTRVLAQDEREPQPLLDPRQPRCADLVRMCSWCKKVDLGGRWAEVEEAVERLGLLSLTRLPDLTHGICDGCHDWMGGSLDVPERTTEAALTT